MLYLNMKDMVLVCVLGDDNKIFISFIGSNY